MDEIRTEAELRELLGEPTPAAVGKERTSLDDIHRQWLGPVPRLAPSLRGNHGPVHGPVLS